MAPSAATVAMSPVSDHRRPSHSTNVAADLALGPCGNRAECVRCAVNATDEARARLDGPVRLFVHHHRLFGRELRGFSGLSLVGPKKMRPAWIPVSDDP